jgi:hemoglobin
MDAEWSPFAELGGEEGIRRLVDTFYDAMDQLPEARTIREMHPEDLGESRRRLWMFLVGRFGGPPLYQQERGHPMLRARHGPFPIDLDAAGAWMLCMDAALQIHVSQGPLREELREFFASVAVRMVNR